MSTCQNCKSTLSCGCQRRVATDGTNVCANCVTAYEQNIINNSNANKTATMIYAKVTPATDNNSLNKL